MTKKLIAIALATGAMFGVYGKNFSLDLRSPNIGGTKRLLASTGTPKADGMLRTFVLEAGMADVGEVTVGDILTFTLFDDVTVSLTLKEKMPSPLGGDVFIAEASGYEGVKNAVVLRTDDGLVVDVQDYREKKVYKVISTADGVTVQEIEPKGGGTCGCDTLKPTLSGGTVKSARRLATASPDQVDTFVDILVAYEQNAVAWAQSYGGGVTNFAQTAVQKMNIALANVGLDSSFRFRLVGVVEVTASTRSLDYALDYATAGTHGWGAVKTKRNEVGADIVTLLVDTGSAYGMTGLGWSLEKDNFDDFSESAYNACSIRAVAQSHTMTHEVGHNMGCGHSDVQQTQPGPQLYDYSSGYYFSADGEKYHTIMAYDGEGPGGSEVPYFSSPNRTYRGVAVGNSSHDNAKTLSNTFAVVAQWRDSSTGEISGGENSDEEYFYGNDSFDDAKELTGESGKIGGSTVDAIGNIDEFLAQKYKSRHTVWYKWKAPSDGQLTVDVEMADFNTVMAAFRGNSSSSLTTVAHNDDKTSNDRLSAVSFDVAQGVTYYICVGGYMMERGDFRLKWELKGFTMVYAVVAEDCKEMGSVTGGNKSFRAGAKVPLKASPNEGYVFVGWYDDKSAVITKEASFTYIATDEEKTFTARFASVEDDKASITLVVNGMSDASAETPMHTNVLCGVALKWPIAASALSGAKVKVAGLPTGLKFTDKPVTSKVGSGKTAVVVTNVPANTIYGAPSAASKVDKSAGAGRLPYQVKITVTTGGKSSVTYLLRLTVDPLPAWAVGSFEGFVRHSVSAYDVGVASMNVTAAGKISGKIASCGTNWTFKADSFSMGSVATNFAVDVIATAGKESRNIQLDVVSFPTEYIPDSATARAEGSFGDLSATLFRLPWTDKGDADVKSYLSAYAGSYTCKVPYGQDDEGEAKFTFDEKGVAKGSVVLPDGMKTRKVSFSASAMTYAGSIYIAIYAAPDAKKGYPAVFDLRQLCEWSGPDDDAIAYRDPGVHVTTEERNKGSGASGTVTMNPKYGQAAAGKDVAITAKPTDKNSVFSYWVVAGADTTGLDLTSPTIKLKANGTNDIDVTAQFVTLAEDQEEIMLIVDNSSLYGGLNDPGKSNVTKRADCGVVVDWTVRANAYSQTTIKAEKLPDGLKLVQDKVTKAYSITGVPTKAGTFPTRFTVTTAGKSKDIVLLPIEIRAMPPDIVGNYTGMVGGFEDEADDDTWRAFGMMTLSVSANGKLSAKATLPSGAISFSENGWDSESNGFYRVEMSTKAGDRLFLKLDSNRDWKGARIEMPDSVLETAKGVAYLVVAWRNEHGKTGKIATNKKASDFIARIVALKKLCFKVTGDAETGYTCTEVPTTDKTANLTLTFDTKGNVKYSGKIGGKSINGTSVLNIDGDDYFTIGDIAVPFGKTETLYLALGFDRGEGGDPEPNLDIFESR